MAASFPVKAGSLHAALASVVHFLGWPRQRNASPCRCGSEAPATEPRDQRLSLPMDVSRQGGVCVTGLDKTRAEELLDRLEACGVRDARVTYVPGQGFTVYSGGAGPAGAHRA